MHEGLVKLAIDVRNRARIVDGGQGWYTLSRSGRMWLLCRNVEVGMEDCIRSVQGLFNQNNNTWSNVVHLLLKLFE